MAFTYRTLHSELTVSELLEIAHRLSAEAEHPGEHVHVTATTDEVVFVVSDDEED